MDLKESLGLSRNKLAIALCVPAQGIGQVVKGQRSITVDTAMRLAKFFGTTPQFWLNIQQQYDLEVAKDDQLVVRLYGPRFYLKLNFRRSMRSSASLDVRVLVLLLALFAVNAGAIRRRFCGDSWGYLGQRQFFNRSGDSGNIND